MNELDVALIDYAEADAKLAQLQWIESHRPLNATEETLFTHWYRQWLAAEDILLQHDSIPF